MILTSDLLIIYKMKSSKKSIRRSLVRSGTRTHLTIIKDILLNFENFTELLEQFNIGDCVNDSMQLSVKKLFKKLERNCNFFFKNQIIKYYLEDGDIWMKCPRINYFIEQEDFMPFSELKFQMRVESDLISVVMNQNQISDEQQDEIDDEDIENQGKCRRLKERKIKNVIEKVLKWRELYAGIKNGMETQQKIPLQQGADIVKVSKKTLDDYLAQIKKGKKYGFNFNEHKNDKVGVLRQFIRKMERKGQK